MAPGCSSNTRQVPVPSLGPSYSPGGLPDRPHRAEAGAQGTRRFCSPGPLLPTLGQPASVYKDTTSCIFCSSFWLARTANVLSPFLDGFLKRLVQKTQCSRSFLPPC